MSGSLEHSAAHVIRQALIDLGVGTWPDDGGDWPVFAGAEPDSRKAAKAGEVGVPDSVITVYDTQGDANLGRIQIDGEQQESPGILVRVRAAREQAGFRKADQIKEALDKSILNTEVMVGDASYTVYSASRTSPVIALGRMTPTSNLRLFTVNAVVALRQAGAA